MKKSLLIIVCMLFCLLTLSGGILAADIHELSQIEALQSSTEPALNLNVLGIEPLSEEENVSWSNYADTSWYNTSDRSFKIDTAEKLAGLAAIVNGTANGISRDNFAGKTVILTADIDLGGVKSEDGLWSGRNWVAIGINSDYYHNPDYMAFAGTFDGNGHSIKNIYIDVTSSTVGLFSYIGPTGKVMHLNMESGYISAVSVVGAIAGGCQGVIMDCHNGADVVGTSNGIGGIVGLLVKSSAAQNYPIVYRCSNGGDVRGMGAGGIVGKLGNLRNDNSKVLDCYNTGNVDITSRDESLNSWSNAGGGIAGVVSGIISNSYSSGKVLCDDTLPYVGGIAGYRNYQSLFTNSYYLKSDSVNNELSGVGAADSNITVSEGTASKTDAELKALADILGGSFSADRNLINNGYPILNWESTGTYEPDETEDLNISSVVFSNGSIVVTLDKNLVYTTLTVKDFAVSATQQIVGEEKADYALAPVTITSSLSEDGKATVATLVCPVINGTYADAVYQVSVSFGGKSAVLSNEITVDVSDYWKDYADAEGLPGEGTYEDPFEVGTAEQLSYLSAAVANGNTYRGKYIVLTADIDLKTSTKNNRELKWSPIGAERLFAGNFDGRNHVIKNMMVDGTSKYNGLFGYVSGGRIINVKLENAVVTSEKAYTGALVGYAYNSDINNCHVLSGVVSGGESVGGLVGYMQGQGTVTPYSIQNSSSAADVRGYIVGGLVGKYGAIKNNNGILFLKDSCSTGNVTAYSGGENVGNAAGGLIGTCAKLYIATVENCYASGSVTVENCDCRVGGLIGDVGLGGAANTVGSLVVKNNVVLVPSLSGAAATSGYGRIVGIGTYTSDDIVGELSANIASDAMMIDGKVFSGSVGDSDINGVSRTSAALSDKDIWEKLGFDFSANGTWKWSASINRPVFSEVDAIYDIVVTEHPVNTMAYNDRDAVFYVSAVKGVGALQYQWQISLDNGKNWSDIAGAVSQNVSIAGKLRYDGALVRCEITDAANTVVYTDNAVLTVMDEDFTPKTVANNLYAKYASGMISDMKLPASMYALSGDLSDCNIQIDYYDSYNVNDSTANAVFYGKGMKAWAAIDYMAQGGTPAEYLKTGSAGSDKEKTNLINEYLAMQNAVGDGSFYNGAETGIAEEGIMSNINYVLAIDMYYNGASRWGNENEEGTAGKAAAFNYLMSQMKDHAASGGRYYYSITKCFGSNLPKIALRYNAEFAILMARFANDPAFENQAKAAMYDVLDVLEYQYNANQMKFTESAARYVSALIAAANVTDSESRRTAYLEQANEVSAKIMGAMAKDGTFAESLTIYTVPSTGNTQATAAVLMAFADMTTGQSALATMSFKATDSQILAADIAEISIPAVVMNDIDLPASGLQGSSFAWTSSDNEVISDNGKVTRPAKDTSLTLTLNAVYGGATVTKTYNVIVTAEREAGGDEVFADITSLSLLPEAIYDIALPVTGDNGSVISWASSNPDVISAEGKVDRSAVADGAEYEMVTLTATVVHGETSQTRDFAVKVWANVDTATEEGMIKEAYYQSRDIYMHKTVLNGYWDVWAAYAALGDEITKYDYIYSDSTNSVSQMGAQVLGIVALGENPYKYNGVNYVEKLKNAGISEGAWSVPVFNAMAVQSAGMSVADNEIKTVLQLSSSWMKNLSMGPDIGGWSVVPASRFLDDPEQYSDVEYFVNAVAGNIIGQSTGDGAISSGCVVTALTALLDREIQINGIEGLDPTKNEPWLSQNVIGKMYHSYSNCFGNDVSGFNTQFAMEFCDLYNVLYTDRQIGWIECGVSKSRLDSQIAKANEILDNRDSYTADSIEDIEEALALVNGISESRLSKEIADYGKEYYTLYDSVRYAKPINVSIVDDAALNNAKAAAREEVEIAFDTYDSNDYTATNWDDLIAAKKEGFTMINAAKDEKTVMEAKNAALAAMAAVPASGNASQISVTFRLIGATKSTQEIDFSLTPGEYYGSEYQNWIKTKTYCIDEGANVYDVLIMALNDNRMIQTGGSAGYIASVTAPAALGGEPLSEFDNGPNSGWMYTINGIHPSYSVKQYILKDGDSIVFHYVNDFKYEDESTNPTSEYLNKWLEVSDTDPSVVSDDEAAAKAVEEQIAAIGEVTKESKDAIEAARAAYDALTEEQKGFVENLDTLIAAEKAYADLTAVLPFTDLEQDGWYLDSVRYVYVNGIMNGMTATTFEPNGTLTRAMYITMLYRLNGEPEVKTGSAYGDIKGDEWYAKAVAWGTENGIVEGYAGNFAPEESITREQMAAMMYRYAKLNGGDVSVSASFDAFKDGSSVSDWAKEEMGWAVASGLMQGHDNGTLEPQGNATRAQAAAVLQRFAEMTQN